MPSLIWKGPSNALIMQPESGRVTVSDRIRSQDVYKCYSGWSITIPNRGTLGTGSRLGWVVSDAEYAPERGGIVKYTINWEAGGPNCGLTPPATEIKLEPQEIYPKVERNPYFQDADGNYLISGYDAALAYATMHAATPAARAWALDELQGRAKNPANNPSATLAVTLAGLLASGNETYYLAGWRYTVLSYSFTVPSTTPGGIIEDPTPQPASSYFDTDIDWLRLADALESSGPINSVWKLTQTWLGLGSGGWNPNLYDTYTPPPPIYRA
jgi:hypothetical protein